MSGEGVWAVLTNAGTWEKWYGIPVASTDWREGGSITFADGGTCGIKGYREGESLTIEDTWTDTTITLRWSGSGTIISLVEVGKGATWLDDKVAEERQKRVDKLATLAKAAASSNFAPDAQEPVQPAVQDPQSRSPAPPQLAASWTPPSNQQVPPSNQQPSSQPGAWAVQAHPQAQPAVPGVVASSSAAVGAPQRALWTVGFLIGFWLLEFLLLQFASFNMSYMRIRFFTGATLSLVFVAIEGTAAYLVSLSDRKWNYWGIGMGALVAVSGLVRYPGIAYGYVAPTAFAVNTLISVASIALTLASAKFARRIPAIAARGEYAPAYVAAGVYGVLRIAGSLVSAAVRPALYGEGILIGTSLLTGIASAVIATGVLLGAFVLVSRLCALRDLRVRLHGLGLAWAWLEAVIMTLGFVGIFVMMASSRYGTSIYDYTLLLAAAGSVGYIMLLAHRRYGMYVLFIGCGAAVLAQLSVGVNTAAFGYGDNSALDVASSLFGGVVNLLFAWLAVRSADKRAAQPQMMTYQQWQQVASGQAPISMPQTGQAVPACQPQQEAPAQPVQTSFAQPYATWAPAGAQTTAAPPQPPAAQPRAWGNPPSSEQEPRQE